MFLLLLFILSLINLGIFVLEGIIFICYSGFSKSYSHSRIRMLKFYLSELETWLSLERRQLFRVMGPEGWTLIRYDWHPCKKRKTHQSCSYTHRMGHESTQYRGGQGERLRRSKSYQCLDCRFPTSKLLHDRWCSNAQLEKSPRLPCECFALSLPISESHNSHYMYIGCIFLH